MVDQAIRAARDGMKFVLEALEEQLKTLHVGRANAGMVENIEVDYYGSRMPLKQVSSVTIPEPNQILMTPWDKGALGPIESAIRDSDLKLNPINDGKGVRVVLPALTEERRRELAKLVGKMAEEARIALRNERHSALESIQKAQKDGTITEDDLERARKELDKLIDEMNREVEATAKRKEQEMMAV